MEHNLQHPCVGCPFTTTAVPAPGLAELQQIFVGTTHREYSMTCHRTKGRGWAEEWCYGARQQRVRHGLWVPHEQENAGEHAIFP